MKIFLSLFLFLTFIACNIKNESCLSSVKVKISNNSTLSSNIEVSVFGNKLLSTKLSSSISSKDTSLCFDGITKTDGNYRIHVKNSDIDSTTNWGYFSNGIPSNSTIQITIYKKVFKITEIPN